MNTNMTIPRAVLFVAWGDPFITEVLECIAGSRMPACPVYLLTDESSAVPEDAPFEVIRASFELDGKLRKAELLQHLPDEVETWMFLDSDTRVLAGLELGFEMAERHGLALALAPHCTLETFRGFGEVMDAEGVPRAGQAQFNTGVMFFRRTPEVDRIFQSWREVCLAHADRPHSDQPYFSLVLEKLGFRPYTLSAAFNYRGIGEWVAGPIRVWHTRDALPAGANESSEFRRVREGEVLQSSGRPSPLAILRASAAALLVAIAILLTFLATRGQSVWALLHVGVLLALVFVLGAPRRLRRSRLLQRSVLAASVLMALVVLPELGLRAAGYHQTAGVSTGPPRATRFARFVAHDELLWTRAPGDSDINELGFPGPEVPETKPPGISRLLFLGDSCTAQGFPSRVSERIPGTDAVALACQGYSSLQGRRMADLYGRDLEADAVFVYFGWNDHWRTRSVPDAERLAPGSWTRLVERSRLLQLVASAVGGGASDPTDRPRVSAAEYRDNLAAIAGTFPGVPVVLVTAPSTHPSLGVPDYLTVEGFAPDAETVLEEHASYNRIVREVAAELTDAHLLDLEAAYADLPGDELRNLFRTDGIHFTEAGLERVAADIAAFLARTGIVSR